MIRSFPPHPNPLPPGERGGHSSPQQSWGVFWHIFIKLCAKWEQNIGYASEAPISKHQISNNIQIRISNDPNGFISEFGDWKLFGIWDLDNGISMPLWFRLCRVRKLDFEQSCDLAFISACDLQSFLSPL
jgi:hypothetical protein